MFTSGFILEFHPLVMCVGMVVGWTATMNGHSGYDLPWADSPVLFARDSHDKHHEYFDVNYGSFGPMDWLFSTNWKTSQENMLRKLSKVQSAAVENGARIASSSKELPLKQQ
jgi:sterol desaturase/sphingolipid hydroxylase (fatty acid hydroxylase superfamily)